MVARLGDFVPMLKRWAFNFANSYIAMRCRPGSSTLSRCCRMPAAARRASITPTPTRQRRTMALLQYTGGTTGVPKGAMLTHRKLIANTLQCLAWTGASAKDERELLTPLPLYHIFSLTANLLTLRSSAA